MSLGHGAKIIRDGLIFAYDMGSKKSWKGKPTTNLVSNPRGLPSNPYTYYSQISSIYVASDIGGSGFGFSRYPNSNLSADGGVEWLHNVRDPLGKSGVWKMRVRPGGNSETQLYSLVGSIDSTKEVTLSVYVKCNIPNTARIHLNVTKNGASSWGYASSYHTGNGEWERLSMTIPANSGVTSINVFRAQAIGRNKTDDILISDFQAEYGSFETPFVEGTRSNTEAINDWVGGSTITANSLIYNSDNTFSFDGTTQDNYCTITPNSDIYNLRNSTQISVEAWVKYTSYSGGAESYSVITVWGNPWVWLLENPSNKLRFRIHAGGSDVSVIDPDVHPLNTWLHVVGTYDGDSMKVYVNGDLKNTRAQTGMLASAPSGTPKIGTFQGTNYCMSGDIAIVKIYNKPLSDTEVSKNYNALKGRFID